jgi:hypothetical protein
MTLAFRLFLFAALICVGLAGRDARAESVGEAAEKWGLLGTWAIDCTKPPSRENGYLAYARNGEQVVHRRDFGDLSDTHWVTGAKLLSGGAIEIVMDISGFAQTRTMVLVKTGDGRSRTISNRDDAGRFSIKDGKFIANGKPAPWQTRCPALTQ